ncbi:putative reverse transcriptase domain-containing protein [Tanacetum coccineum]
MLQGMVTRNRMKDLDLYVPSATTTMTFLVHPGAITAKRLAIWLGTVGVGLRLPTTITLITTTTTATTTITTTTTTTTITTTTTATTTTIIEEPKGQIPMSLLSLSVELRATSRGTAHSGRTRIKGMVTGTLIDIIPTTLDHGYDVELADDRIIGVNTVLRGCTLNFLNHLFHIDLMPVEMGSFDVIIGMDWLTKYHVVIDYAKKIVRIPFGNEILIVRGDRSNNEHGTRLNIISCTKTQKYLQKGCHVFLAHVTAKKTEDKSKEKQLEDVPIVKDFPEVFPDAGSGYQQKRQKTKQMKN